MVPLRGGTLQGQVADLDRAVHVGDGHAEHVPAQLAHLGPDHLAQGAHLPQAGQAAAGGPEVVGQTDQVGRQGEQVVGVDPDQPVGLGRHIGLDRQPPHGPGLVDGVDGQAPHRVPDPFRRGGAAAL